MKLFGGFRGNRSIDKNERPVPEETEEQILRAAVIPASREPRSTEESAVKPTSEAQPAPETPKTPAGASLSGETKRIPEVKPSGETQHIPEAKPSEETDPASGTKAPEAAPALDAGAALSGETKRIPEVKPGAEAPEAAASGLSAGDTKPYPELKPGGDDASGEKTITFRTPEEEAEIEEIIAAYQKKKRRRRLIVLAVLVLLVAGGLILWKTMVKPPEIVQPTLKPTAAPTARPTATPGPKDDPAASPTPTPEPEETPPPERMRRENVYTFLLVGRDQGYANTDTIMLGVFDTESGTVDVVSIPRDTCANVESNPRNGELKKISGVYSRAGFEGLKEAVEDMAGFPIDCYVSVGVNGFIQLVETIGGVYFKVPHNMNYDDPTQDLHIHFSAGEQYLNGYDAIKVVRWRQNNDGTNYGDIDRINTQQEFLKTVFKKCLSLNNLVANLDDYIKIFQEYVKTDLTTGNMTWFAKEVLKLKSEDIRFHTMPSYYNDVIYGFSYGTVLVDEWLEMINECLNPFDQPVTLEDVDLIYRDENGSLVCTSGEIKGGMDSFLHYDDYLRDLRAWQASQAPKTEESAGDAGNADGAGDAGTAEAAGGTEEEGAAGDAGSTAEEGAAGDAGSTAEEGAAGDVGGGESSGDVSGAGSAGDTGDSGGSEGDSVPQANSGGDGGDTNGGE